MIINKKTIFTFQLTDGMIIANDILSVSGQLLVAQGSIVNDRVRDILKLYNIQQIVVGEEEVITKPIGKVGAIDITTPTIPEITYSERVKASDDFKTFSTNFSSTLNTFTDELNNIVKKASSLNPEKLLESTFSILPEGGSSIHIFDMLHNMKAYDDSTFSHSLNVSLICYVFGQWLHLDPIDIKVLSLAGLLHDIGKLLIDDSIIKKPSSLTPIEYNIIQSHPILGYNLLKDSTLDVRVKNAILMHHEKSDGSGYPSKLKSDKIEYFAKIVTIADVYDAMTSNRVYRSALCPFEVIRNFEREGFQKYDTQLILTFLEQIGQTYINNYVLLSDGRKGRIVLINQHALSKPIVQIDNDYVDLSKKQDLNITEIL